MALPLWSQLQKALDDPETIEEAIIRLIAVHNNAPESHLNEGQSLHNHSHEPVIDHPERSVPFDKTATNDFVLPVNTFSTTPWTFTNLTGFAGATGIRISNTTQATTGTLAYIPIADLDSVYSSPTFLIYDFQGQFLTEDYDDRYTFGLRRLVPFRDTIGFRLEGGSLYGTVTIGTTTTETTGYATGATGGDPLYTRCRVVYNYSDNTLTYFLNDVQIGVLSPTSDVVIPNFAFFTADNTSGDSNPFDLTVFNLSISVGTY